jgi:cell division protein FtsW (lipid II flippase)
LNTSHTQARLFGYAAAFLFLYSVALTLAPAVRERTWAVDYRWTHWIGFAVWAGAFAFVHRWTSRRLPEADPFLLPIASLLTGWGLLTIFRLEPDFGLRQTVWLIVSLAAFLLVLHFSTDLSLLRRYKYVALLGGLLLTALTLVFGTSPTGSGPRLWLGAADFYLQPSEPLKLLLIIYLTAYLADRLPNELAERAPFGRAFSFPLLVPTLLMTGISLLILLVQRDLGTASIFLLLYTIILFLATGKHRVLILTAVGLGLAALVGYFSVDIIHVRLDAWLDPWADPSGRSFQIVQSLLAIANGGTLGRGPGLGSPSLVPVAISDFIFSAIAEEAGLLGVVALLGLIGLLLSRGLRAALQATDRFGRLLASSLTAYIGVQSLLILGGNLRLLPLTGVTLPFVSYGGSSLLTCFLALAILLRVGAQVEDEPAPLPNARPYTTLSGLFTLGLFACALATGWWAVVRGPDLLSRTDNARRSIADRYVRRGSILDRENRPITVTSETTPYSRRYLYTPLSPVIGYTQPTYGQAGLERTLDGYLRGYQGNPTSLLWTDHLLYGTPPPGLDVRLSIDLSLQKKADELLGGHKGALILLNAQTGEILVMASHPTYDPNLLEQTGQSLLTNPDSPLVNRAAQGMYPIGSTLDPVLAALFGPESDRKADQLTKLFNDLGFYTAPELHLPTGLASPPGEITNLRVSPLQMALAVAALSGEGVRPAPRIALAVNTPAQGWVILPTLESDQPALSPNDASRVAEGLVAPGSPYWRLMGNASEKGQILRWYLSGTMPRAEWQGTPLTVVVLLEEDNANLAEWIGAHILQAALESN